MFAVFVNTIAVIIGSLIGLFFKEKIPKNISAPIMTGIGLCTLSIGISGTLKGENSLLLIISIVLGVIIGELIGLDRKIELIGGFFQNRLNKNDDNKIVEGFVTGSLLFCIGAMTIIGSLNAGLLGDYKMLYTKSILDMIAALMLSTTLGVGVLFSSIFVFVFQGAIVLLAQSLQTILNSVIIAELTSVGSLLIIAIGLNIIGITKIKVANFLPSIFLVPLIYWLLFS
nr:DUF554 domain-containing protein [uncultured Cetobacterium sp.]